MKIEDLLSPDLMIMDLKATTQEEAIKEMADLEVKQGVVNNEDEFIKSIWAREKESTTGIGEGIAMPHARNKYINRAAVLFAKSPKGIDYKALDGQPVHLFFMITAPAGADNTHLQALAKLSSLLINPDVVNALKAATTPEEVIDIFKKAEAEKFLGTDDSSLVERIGEKVKIITGDYDNIKITTLEDLLSLK